MRKLLLLRHAKSSWDDPALTDFDRPLSQRGREASARLARFVEQAGPPPDQALVSSARRTRETWETVARGWPEIPVLFEPGLYAAGESELSRRLHQLDDSILSVILVGHNPGVERLAETLGGQRGEPWALDRLARKYPTGALAELTLEIESWRAVAPDCGRLVRFTRPVDLDGIVDDD